MILKLIDRLDKKGYQLVLATDVARYFELSTLFFTQKPPKGKTGTSGKINFNFIYQNLGAVLLQIEF